MVFAMHIGNIELATPLALAPMAGITDKPFRMLCRRFGAGLASSEMTTSDPSLQNTRKTLQRADHSGETGIRSVQIVGNIPEVMAEAAKLNVARGAQIIDINMGCPAKKVCKRLAGSALLKDEDLVARILDAVVQAVDVPVTLKTRLGYVNGEENILRVAARAEQVGIAALAIHGRTREQMYTGQARYELIREVKQLLRIPVIANGDIDSPHKAKSVLAQTGAVSWAGPLLCADFGAKDGVDEICQAFFEDLLCGQGEGAGWRLPKERGAATAQPEGVDIPGAAILWGSNLAVLVSLLGTPYFPQIDGGILFLEDVGEHPYRIERMLTQLLHAGVLARQKAIVLGQFTDYSLSRHDAGFKLQTVVDRLRGQVACPVLTGLPFGHVPTKVLLPVGATVSLSVQGRGGTALLGACVRS